MATTKWNKAMRLPLSEGGTPICQKHDFVLDNYMDQDMAWEVGEALRQAKDDGERMERAIQALGDEANNLEEECEALGRERDALESMRSRLCAALGLPADSAPETVAEAVEARRVVVPEPTVRQWIDEVLDVAREDPETHATMRAATRWFRDNARAIPADRVLGEGMVAVERGEIERLRELRAALLQALRCQHMREWFRMTKRLGDALDASHHPPVIRANQGGAEHGNG